MAASASMYKNSLRRIGVFRFLRLESMLILSFTDVQKQIDKLLSDGFCCFTVGVFLG